MGNARKSPKSSEWGAQLRSESTASGDADHGVEEGDCGPDWLPTASPAPQVERLDSHLRGWLSISCAARNGRWGVEPPACLSTPPQSLLGVSLVPAAEPGETNVGGLAWVMRPPLAPDPGAWPPAGTHECRGRAQRHPPPTAKQGRGTRRAPPLDAPAPRRTCRWRHAGLSRGLGVSCLQFS